MIYCVTYSVEVVVRLIVVVMTVVDDPLLAAKAVEEPPTADRTEDFTDSAAVIGQMVVVMAMVSVMTPLPAEDLAGQFVMVGAQLVMV